MLRKCHQKHQVKNNNKKSFKQKQEKAQGLVCHNVKYQYAQLMQFYSTQITQGQRRR